MTYDIARHKIVLCGGGETWVLGVPPCSAPSITSHPIAQAVCPSGTATFSVTPAGTGPLTHQWQVSDTAASGGWASVSDGPLTIGGSPTCASVTGAHDPTLVLALACTAGAGDVDGRQFRCIVTNACGSVTSNPATLTICVADTDDGSGTGTCDGGVTIDDLLYYLRIFEEGAIAADVDDGSSTGTPDGGVTIDDLLYYLLRFEAGC